MKVTLLFFFSTGLKHSRIVEMHSKYKKTQKTTNLEVWVWGGGGGRGLGGKKREK